MQNLFSVYESEKFCCGNFYKFRGVKFRVVLLVVLSLLFSSSTFAQMNFCSSVGKVDLISVKRVGQNEGQITFSVKDKEGNNVDTDIAPDEISLLINGHEVCNKVISRESRSLLDLVIAVDVSKSMDDAIRALQEGLPDLITAIGNNFDAQGQVVSFGKGSYVECPFDFWGEYNLEVIDEKFINNCYTEEKRETNINAYNYEGYYSMLLQIAGYPYKNYRPQAQKAIIMLGNESASAPTNEGGEKERSNDMDCQNGGRKIKQEEVIDSLNKAGFVVFIINGEDGFTEIAEKTGGAEFNVKDNSYDYRPSVLPAIAEAMKTIYTMKFDYCDYVPDCNNVVPSTLSICGYQSEINSKLDDAPSIIREAETIALDRDGVAKNNAVTISFVVNHSDCKEVDRAEISYSYRDNNGEVVAVTEVCESNGGIFSLVIPAERVNPEMIEYTIHAYFTDNTTVSSSPISMGLTGYTWTIPVRDAQAPVVSNIQWSGDFQYACGEKRVCAEITDRDGKIEEAYIMYSDYIPGVEKYTFAHSAPLTTDDGSTYCALLPAEAGSANGLAYYIFAKDNDGIKGFYEDKNGNENYAVLEYKQETSNETIEVELVREDGCETDFERGDYVVAYYQGCNGALVSAGSATLEEEGGMVKIYLNTSEERQNGVKEGQPVYVAFYRVTEDGRFVSSKYVKIEELEEGMYVGVCPDKEVDDMITVYSESGMKIENGQIVYMNAKGASSASSLRSAMSFNIVNDSEEGNDWIINGMKIVPNTHFSISPEIKDSVVAYGENLSFSVAYEGEGAAEADLYIYNNTLTDPMVVHLVVEGQEPCGDKIVWVQKDMVGIRIEGNQEYVNFKATSDDGRVLADYEGFLGHGIQNRQIPIEGVDKFYVELTKNGETCVEEVALNGSDNQEPEGGEEEQEPFDDCDGIINNITTQYVTMADIHVAEQAVVYMEVLHLNGTPTGCHYGPQMNHAADHNHYLGNQLPSNTYVLKVMIDNKVCSSTFVVK